MLASPRYHSLVEVEGLVAIEAFPEKGALIDDTLNS